MPSSYTGTHRKETAQSKYSHKLTKVDTSTDVFDKFRLLCVFKCEPDGSEQWGLASLIVCGGYTQGTLELIRAEERAFLPQQKKGKKEKRNPLSFSMIQWFNSFQRQTQSTHTQPLPVSCFHFLLDQSTTHPTSLEIRLHQLLKTGQFSCYFYCMDSNIFITSHMILFEDLFTNSEPFSFPFSLCNYFRTTLQVVVNMK